MTQPCATCLDHQSSVTEHPALSAGAFGGVTAVSLPRACTCICWASSPEKLFFMFQHQYVWMKKRVCCGQPKLGVQLTTKFIHEGDSQGQELSFPNFSASSDPSYSASCCSTGTGTGIAPHQSLLVSERTNSSAMRGYSATKRAPLWQRSPAEEQEEGAVPSPPSPRAARVPYPRSA